MVAGMVTSLSLKGSNDIYHCISDVTDNHQQDLLVNVSVFDMVQNRMISINQFSVSGHSS